MRLLLGGVGCIVGDYPHLFVGNAWKMGMSQFVPVQALLFLVVFGVSGTIGLLLGGALGAALFGVLGLAVYSLTRSDVEQSNDS
jgi:membrane associated rhomboid family serine protease